MPILISQPIVVPEKTYDKYWAWQIVITSLIPKGEAQAVVSLLPYNEQGETYKEGSKVMYVKDIMAKAAANPDGNFAKAMYFLLLAIDEEKIRQDSQGEQPAPSPEGDTP